MQVVVLISSLLLLYFGSCFFLSKCCGLTHSLRYPISFAITVALISYGYYLSLLFHSDFRLLMTGFILIPGAYMAVQLPRKADMLVFRSKVYGSSIPLIPLIAILILVIRFNKYAHRWGDWDAWAIWNLHAKFLFYPDYWLNLFTSKLAETHPDYPLMLPSLIAFFWRGVGFVTPLVPVIVAHSVLIAIALTVFLGLKRFQHSFAATLALTILVLDAKFININAAQYADSLVAFFVLVTFVVYKETKALFNPKLVFLLGFIAGSATWIKNEGLLFFLVFSLAYLCFNFRKPESVLLYAAGALIPLLILVHFKMTLAPANDLIHSDRSDDLVSLILNPERYLLIIKHFVFTSLRYYWIVIVLFAMLLVNKIRFVKTLPFMVVSFMLAGYFAVYLTTPNDLDWHLGASLDRLLHHIYPASLYLLLLKFSSDRTSRIWG
jgi:hypothetical protein